MGEEGGCVEVEEDGVGAAGNESVGKTMAGGTGGRRDCPWEDCTAGSFDAGLLLMLLLWPLSSSLSPSATMAGKGLLGS